jgi:hypothetical protein
MTALLSGIKGFRLREVFSRMRKRNLKLQPDKYKFLLREVLYLGHVIGPTGVKPDYKRVKDVRAYPEPRTTHELRGCLSLAGYYRRFIPNFSKIAKPLTEMLKKNVPYTWNGETEAAFSTLKTLLTTEPLLQYPDFTSPFVFTTDASNDALGAVLSQGPVGKDLPIAYASRTLNNAERNYPTKE